jgi:hypothetical protein
VRSPLRAAPRGLTGFSFRASYLELFDVVNPMDGLIVFLNGILDGIVFNASSYNQYYMALADYCYVERKS